MKRNFPLRKGSRFNAHLRYYHRSRKTSRHSWDNWIDGDGSNPRNPRNWLKIAGFFLALMVLGAFIARLVISMI
jgi:hypothetical protein